MASPAVGVAPIPGLLGEQGRRAAPADLAVLRQIAGEPSPTRAGFLDTDERRTFRVQLTDELSNGTWAGPHGAEGDDRSVVFLGAIGDRKRVFMDIQTDGAWARRRQG